MEDTLKVLTEESLMRNNKDKIKVQDELEYLKMVYRMKNKIWENGI